MRNDLWKKELVCIIIMYFVEVNVVQQIQPTIKVDIIDGLVGYWNFND